MAKFGKRSMMQLSTIDPRLQVILGNAIRRMDFSVLCGHRGEKEQNDAYNRGVSKLRFPRSKHNRSPSAAVDVAPYPIDWSDLDRFRKLKAIIFDEAAKIGVDLIWGADWDGDGDEMDHSLRDYPHFEIQE